MKELTADIWNYYNSGYTIAIPTNGTVNVKGQLVMGRGLAAQAKGVRYDLPMILGLLVGTHLYGNHVHHISCRRIFTFPVKHNWWELADINLIQRSAEELLGKVEKYRDELKEDGVLIPRVGCGAGKLQWEVVRPVLEAVFGDERVTVIYNGV